MAYKWIERVMILMAASPVVTSLLYRGSEIIKGIENAINPFDTTIALFGVIGTIAALILLVYSLQKQDKQHKEQILQMGENHEEHLKEVREQFLTQMSQIIGDDRENYLTKYIAAAASNIHYYKQLNVSKGVFLFCHYNRMQDNFCIVFWNMRYKSIQKRDENYIFDLHFKLYSIMEIFGKSTNPENIDHDKISVFVKDEISNRNNNPPYWDFKISIPRFEGEYGRLASDRNFSGMSRVDITQMDALKFACIGDAMGEIQVMKNFELIAARNAANAYRL